MLTLAAKLTIQAGKEWEFEAKMRLIVPKVRVESGIYAYSMHRSQDDSCVFVSYEAYTD